MKAIILSAGQGSRLLPMTESTPKCLLPVYEGYTALSWQLSQLQKAGVSQAVVVTGFFAEKVEQEISKQHFPVRTIFNPFFKVADNLGSVWLAGPEMNEDFILINGDTLFSSVIIDRLSKQATDGINISISRKESYDDDDMKVVESEGKLLEIGKKLRRADVNAESIGMIMFKGSGVDVFRTAVQQAMRSQEALSQYYLSVIGAIAQKFSVNTVEMPSDAWCETDFPADLIKARECVQNWVLATDYDSEKPRKVAG